MSRMLFAIASLLLLSQVAFAQTDFTTHNDVIVSRGIGMMPGMGGEPVQNAPVSARTTNRMVRELCDGNRIVHEQVTLIYRDTDGRFRREHSTGGSSFRKMIMITDPVKHQTWMLEEDTKTAYKNQMFGRRIDAVQGGSGYMMAQPLHESSMAVGTMGAVDFTASAPGGPVFLSTEGIVVGRSGEPMGAGPATVESLGQNTIDGVRVEGTAYTTTYPANMFGNELPIVVQKTIWYAPELQMMVRSEEKDPRMGTVTYTMEILSVEEPDPALFEVPADYRIIEPALTGIPAPIER